MIDLSGRVAIVTGAAGRLGRASVIAMVASGADVLAVDIDEAGAQRACNDAHGGRARPHQADVSDDGSVRGMIQAAVNEFGGVDILFNNAGLIGLEHNVGLLELEMELWDRIMSVNLRSVMLGCKFAIPEMIKRGGGSIINTSSGSSLAGDIENFAYATAKGGINILTRYVAAGYGKENIRCNSIAPGVHLDPAYVASLDDARKVFYARMEDHCLMPRLGTPDDIAKAAVFLASDESSYITGQLLQVDGGLIGHVPHLADVRRAQTATE